MTSAAAHAYLPACLERKELHLRAEALARLHCIGEDLAIHFLQVHAVRSMPNV